MAANYQINSAAALSTGATQTTIENSTLELTASFNLGNDFIFNNAYVLTNTGLSNTFTNHIDLSGSNTTENRG